MIFVYNTGSLIACPYSERPGMIYTSSNLIYNIFVDTFGYGRAGKPLPVVGGQDCIVASCRSILAGEQYATILKDTRSLGAATVILVDDILQGKTITGLDTSSYNNGAKIVPSLLLDSVIVTKDNLMEAVVTTGYHSAGELGL